jgi:hypothetical protein
MHELSLSMTMTYIHVEKKSKVMEKVPNKTL